MKNVFLFLGMAVMTFTSCKKEEVIADTCAGITKLGTTAVINGADQKLSSAILSASQGTFTFAFSSVTSDCNEQNSLNINISNETATNITGTYPIKDFFDANDKDAFGSLTKIKLNPVSSVIEDISSGTVKVTDHGSKDYTIDLVGKTATGAAIAFKVRHKF